MTIINEDTVERQSIDWFKENGYQYKSGSELSLEAKISERDVVLFKPSKDFKKLVNLINNE